MLLVFAVLLRDAICYFSEKDLMPLPTPPEHPETITPNYFTAHAPSAARRRRSVFASPAFDDTLLTRRTVILDGQAEGQQARGTGNGVSALAGWKGSG